MRNNTGMSTLKRKRRQTDAMRDYDRLPAELRVWLASAILPWRPRSVRRTFDSLVARTQDTPRALEELDRLQDRLVAKDARKIWGPNHPCAATIGEQARRERPPGRVPSFAIDFA
jgi:uncharacterized protein with von Willebrand factor type A (vWA) domain